LGAGRSRHLRASRCRRDFSDSLSSRGIWRGRPGLESPVIEAFVEEALVQLG
jgi:hypothetical protein